MEDREGSEEQPGKGEGNKNDDLNINGVIPIVWQHALRIHNNDFEVTSVEKTRHTDGNGDPIFTIRVSDRKVLLKTNYFDSQKDAYTVVDIPPGMRICTQRFMILF